MIAERGEALHINYSGGAVPGRTTAFECAACHLVAHSSDCAKSVEEWAGSVKQCTRGQIPRLLVAA